MTSTDDDCKKSDIIASLEGILVELDELNLTIAAIKVVEAIDELKQPQIEDIQTGK